MEKLNLVKDGVLRLPPGFRFHPTDEELVVQYLKRKVLSCPLPAFIIPEIDVCKSDPWVLPGNLEQERYFFSTREAKYPNGNRSNRATGSGYWKATGLDKQIVSSRSNQVVGMKKTLVFYRGKPPHGSRTDWIMHEYRLLPHASQAQKKNAIQSPPELLNDNWVLCRIFLKKRNSSCKREDENIRSSICVDKSSRKVRNSRPVFYDFLSKNRTDLNLIPASPCSGTSAITEATSNQSDDHEENGSSTGSHLLRKRP